MSTGNRLKAASKPPINPPLYFVWIEDYNEQTGELEPFTVDAETLVDALDVVREASEDGRRATVYQRANMLPQAVPIIRGGRE